MYTEDDDEYVVRPNKAENKREMAAIFVMAEDLLKYRRGELERVGVPAPIIETILETAKMTLDTAKKRNVKFIAKQLRELNFAEVKEFFENLKQNVSLKKKPVVVVEKDAATEWTEKLLGDESTHWLGEFTVTYEKVDRQQLRNLIRNWIKSTDEKKRNGYFLELKVLVGKALK